MQKLTEYIKDPYRIIRGLMRAHWFDWLPDKQYLQLKYRVLMGKTLPLDNPRTYNEKLQWLKLYNRNPQYTDMVDKYKVKDYVAEKIGKEYVIPTIGKWESAYDIDFNTLPEQFVLKCTHDSGGVVICRNKNELNIEKTRHSLEQCLKHSFYLEHREWSYKNVIPQIIAEPYIEDEKTKELRDYKFFVFDGKTQFLFVATDRQKDTDTCFDFFDIEYNHLDLVNGHPNAETIPEKPSKFDEMIVLANKLGQGIPHVRVDFYEANGKVYFGELTFFHWSGMVPFVPEVWDERFGDLINLPENR